ncbi:MULTISPECIES: bifunctional chorismate mutase/prephenate dehydrogenase [unclassified Leptolyngbya]|uniref:bifunctional chorismate mutase/prephenate dehydrogenase n=1 Tax=unclassified Leptolyngbya TaxID=2650499 RepID=UPI0016884864|nr:MULTISPECIES: bifunctional chorismate mutase/prephenate dehydrogenase [unclassified Leptolyngbya]MBD1911610.1 bifunctional chorismate mutase/prephenate dehydrogenase [Leptolyngbya sp. FACHB-8]MBD2155217.1 bifunctional chorismate mutase/prephenate dehydrogenase [Leptolyngbya sp. FACHB-16]
MAGTKTLQQIDQALIALLSERISLLETSGAPSIEEQLSNARSCLMNTNVTEFTWNSLIVNCMAALATETPTPQQKHAQSRRITVIGGRGIMGSFFTERMAAAGHQVSILEYDDWDRADTLLGDADLVLIAVPLKSTVAMVRKVASYLSPNTILADVASTKTEVVQAMMEHHNGPVVGLHPMFGVGSGTFLGKKVVVCPGRNAEASQWLLDLIEADGGTLITCTPEEHDTMMVAVQVIRFFSDFSLGTFYAREGVDIDRSFEFASPLYRSEINIISRLVTQDAALYVDILMASQERLDAIERMVATYSHLADLLKKGDRAGLIAEFEKTGAAFKPGAKRSMVESSYMLNNLSNFVAASQVEMEQTCEAAAA